MRTATAVRHTSGGNTFGGTTAKPPMHDMTYADADGYETITAWRCVEGCAVAALSAQSGELTSGALHKETTGWGSHGIYGSGGKPYIAHAEASSGTAARFFYNSNWQAERLEAADAVIYQAKASTAEREAGLSGRKKQIAHRDYGNIQDGRPHTAEGYEYRAERANTHSTIKPLALVEHLAKLLLPPALYAPRRLFVPFAGAGSEMLGALFAGWEHIEGVELEEDHVSIARSRIEWWEKMMRQTHSSDPGAILKAYGTRDTAKPSSTERWPAGSLFENLEEE